MKDKYQILPIGMYIVLPNDPPKGEVIEELKRFAATLKPKDRKVVDAAIARLEKASTNPTTPSRPG